MRRAGAAAAAYVYDFTAHRVVLALRAAVPRAPASVEKLYTSVALLARLGPAARLRTTVLGTGRLTSGGVWRGNLYMRGGGDPTLGSQGFNAVWEQGFGATLSDLAVQLAGRDGIHRVSGLLIGDESLFDDLRGGPASGYLPDVLDLGGQLGALTYDHGTTRAQSPGAYATAQLARELRALHVQAHAAGSTAPTPPGATELASVSSPPLSTLLVLTNLHSDDFYAEMLTKQLGARFAGYGSTAAGTRVIADVLAGFGLHPRIADGSGLSRANSTTPLQVASLLEAVAGTDLGRALADSLPLAGVSGTLAKRMRGTRAQGRCRAKTGTIDFVSSLAGYCPSRGGHQLAFAIIMDGLPTSYAHALQDQMVAAMARDDPALP